MFGFKYVVYFILFFFFSSRRRHTRLTCDWSSDVCSSDLSTLTHLGLVAKAAGPHVIVALYSDTAGEPDRLVASTPATTLTVGPVEVPVARTPLPAGTYWIMAMHDGDASVGIDASDPDAPVRYMEQSFSDPLPDPTP